MKAVIICGGNGTRLFPASLDFEPKQWCKLFGEKTLIEMTIERLLSFGIKDVLLVYPPKFESKITSTISLFSPEEVTFHKIVEPCSKNTGPAIVLALAYSLATFSDNDYYLISPSDHLLSAPDFEKALTSAKFFADMGITTFGKKPTRVETGFGYISHVRNHIHSFSEKPSAEVAQEYIEKGWLWNMGYFFGRRGVFLKELEEKCPQLLGVCKEYLLTGNSLYFDGVESQPFDKMIMEKSQLSFCVEYSGEWSDVGNWKEVSTLLGKNVINQDSDDVFIISKYPVKVAKSNGVSVIFDDDTYSDVKKLSVASCVSIISKPWGWVRRLLIEKSNVVSRIVIYPRKRTSLQFHRLRSEIVTVLSGEGRVMIGKEYFPLSSDTTITIQGCSLHRIENNSDRELILLETQSGICDEEDITRLQDDYNRS